MRAVPALIAALVLASVSPGAEPVKLLTLTGKALQGDLVSLSDNVIVLKVDDKPVTTPVGEVLQLVLPSAATVPLPESYMDVELADHSLLHGTEFRLKGNQVNLKLVGGQEVKLPLATVSSFLNDAQDPKVREEWQKILARRGKRDLAARKDSEGGINAVEGTLGEGDDQGETIAFETAGGQKGRLRVANLFGMSFYRQPNPEAPAPLCKVTDVAGNVLMASNLATSDRGFTVTTAAGLQVEFGKQAFARLDFSQGKLTYLSDLEPIKVSETSTVGLVHHYHRDQNQDGGPLRVNNREPYLKGLSLHAYTELVYDIDGQYKEFKAILGVDPTVGGDSPVKVVIEGDGRELYSAEVKRQDEPRKIGLDMTNVKQLRIVVSAEGLLDLGTQVNLADAKVSK